MTSEVLESVSQFVTSPRRMLIGAAWVEGERGRTIDVYDPATGQVMCRVPAGDELDVGKAVRAARRAFDSGPWQRVTPYDRGRILLQVADLIDANAEQLAQLEVLDQGKPIAIARGAVASAAEAFRYCAGWCTTTAIGETLAVSRPGRFHAYTRREPVGAAGLIVPWSSPITQASGKVATALAAGCTAVLKPAEQTPLTALRLAEIILEAGVPEGVLNVVTGYGPAAGAALAAHPLVDKVSFTGSTATGRAIVESSTSNLKRVSLELGGKSPTVVLADADLPSAVAGAANSIFFNSGQTCAAGSRLLVHRSILDEVVNGIVSAAEKLTIGPGIDPNTRLGPLVSAEHLAKVASMIESGISEGAEPLVGGRTVDSPGYFVEPTVFAKTRADMRIMKEEIFGPVLGIQTFEDYEEIVGIVNDSDYALGASIWTQDVSAAHRLAADVRAGVVWINCFGTLDFGVPFGGFKQSGWGREHGEEGMNLFTETKSVIAALA